MDFSQQKRHKGNIIYVFRTVTCKKEHIYGWLHWVELSAVSATYKETAFSLIYEKTNNFPLAIYKT